MKTLFIKHLCAFFTVPIILFSCKKDEYFHNTTEDDNLTETVTKLVPAPQKALLVIDDVSQNGELNNPKQAIYLVKNINGTPNKIKLFEGEKGFEITDIAKGPSIGQAFFIYQTNATTTNLDKGIYHINTDGTFPTQILFLPETSDTNYISDIEYNKQDHNLYWEMSGEIDENHTIGYSISRCSVNGSFIESPLKNFQGILIPKTANKGGTFTLNTADHKAFYITGNENSLKIISNNTTDVTEKKSVTNSISSNSYKLKADKNNHKLFIFPYDRNLKGTAGDVYSADMNLQNQVLTTVIPKDNTNKYSERAFDFVTSKMYFSKTSGNNKFTTLFSSDLNGNDVKTIIGGFNNIIRAEVLEVF